jgi:hypothetical protein
MRSASFSGTQRKLNFKTIVGNLFTGKEDSTNVPVGPTCARIRGSATKLKACSTAAGGAKSYRRWWLRFRQRQVFVAA